MSSGVGAVISGIGRKGRRYALVGVLIFVFILIVVLGIVSRAKLREKLIDFTCQQIAMQAKATADSAIHIMSLEKARAARSTVASPYMILELDAKGGTEAFGTHISRAEIDRGFTICRTEGLILLFEDTRADRVLAAYISPGKVKTIMPDYMDDDIHICFAIDQLTGNRMQLEDAVPAYAVSSLPWNSGLGDVPSAKLRESGGTRIFVFSSPLGEGTETYISGYCSYDVFYKYAGGILNVLIGMFMLFALILTFFGAILLIFQSRIEGAREAEAKADATEAAGKAKDEFLASMSHEMRTPINAILGMNELIRRECGDQGPIGEQSASKVRDYATDMDSACTSLLFLVNDILDFSKIEAGRMEVVNAPYSLHEAISGVIAMVHPRAEQKKLELLTDVSPSVPDMLYGDRIRIQQVWLNLLTNAIKYTDKGSVKFSISWEDAGPGHVMIKATVTDTGRGIRNEELPLIFNKFQRADTDMNSSIEGTGLGLAITSSITKMMSGGVKAESTYGKGSVFTAWVIQSVQENQSKTTTFKNLSARKNGPSFYAPDARVLAVDDTALNLKVLCGLLGPCKIKIDAVESGEECLRSLKEWDGYDIILMDARMPGMDGLATLEEIHRQGYARNAKIVVLTADAMAGAEERYLAAGFDAYIQKPIRPSELESALRKLLPANKVENTDCMPDTGNKTIPHNVPDWLYKSREIDPDAGIDLCGGPREYIEVLKAFEESAYDNIEALRRALRNSDARLLETKAHALKSSAKLVGAERLSLIAAEVEKAANIGDLELAGQKLPAMLSLYREIALALSPLQGAEHEQAGMPEPEGEISAEHVRALFLHLKSYVDDFNDEAVGSMTKALSVYKFPGGSQVTFDEFMDAYHALDWSRMQDLLKEY